MKIYSSSKYDQQNGSNWRWSVTPSNQLKIIAQTKDYCEIQAEQGISTANLYFEYDYYSGLSKVTSITRWVITYIPVTSITLNKYSLTLEEGQKETLTSTVKPGEASDNSVNWSSSNNSVATVDNGKVTAKSAGKATITCKANDGSGKQASCEITVISPFVAEINAANFPDENFRKYLLSTSYGEDGRLTRQEINSVTTIDVSGSSSEPGMIRSLNGIGFFAELRNLDCSYNQLTELDISKNTALTELRCYRNQLTELDVSKNTKLTYLACENNKLTELDVSENTKLTYLACYDNQLTALDVSKNTKLTELYCSSNQLTALDVSKNTALTRLFCNNNQLTALDVSKNTALRAFYCNDNHLTELDVSKNKELTEFSCYYNQLTALDVSKNTELISFAFYNNQLTELDVSKNTKLIWLYCNNNQLTALDVSKNTELIYLYCYNNQLTALDVSKNTELEDLDCGYNQLTALDVSKNTELIYLYCYNNQLTALNLSKNTALTDLDCEDNQLTVLDVSKNTELIYLYCCNNQLTALDVSKNTKLTELYCAGNKIKDAAMDDLIMSLPVNQTEEEYTFAVVYTDREEGNLCYEQQVATAKANGWTPRAWNGSTWVEYEGEPINDIKQVTIGSALVAGYSSNRNLDFTSLQDKGVSAWIATGFSKGNVMLSRIYQVPAGEGVYVKAEKAGTYDIPTTTEEAFCVNMFVGVPYGKTVDMYEDYYGEKYLTLSFALSKTTGKPGFFPNTEAKTYGKNKMYLHMPARLLPEYAKTRLNEFSLGLEFEEETTGISDAEHLNDKGQMINDKRGEVYDLQGRKVNAQGTMYRSAEGRLLPTGRKNAQLPKGMYIMNGKKVVVK